MKKILIGAGAITTFLSFITVSKTISNPRIYDTPLGMPLAVWGAMPSIFRSLTRPRKRSALWSSTYQGPNQSKQSIRVCFANVLLSNPYPQNLLSEIRNEDPDLIILAETDAPEWDEYLQEGFPTHFYRFALDTATPGAGFRVISRAPLTQIVAHEVEQNGRAFLTWKCLLPSQKWVSVFALHPAAPITKEWAAEWAKYFSRVTAQIPTDGPLMVVGDFNATQDHGPFRRLVKAVGGDVVTENVPTWPQNSYTYSLSGRIVQAIVGRSRWLLPLDQAIVREIPVQKVYFGQGIGSDHRPVYVDLG